jgi:hypothetical protein
MTSTAVHRTAVNGTAVNGTAANGAAAIGTAMTGPAAATPIVAVRPRDRVVVTGVVRAVTTETVGIGSAVRCVLADGTGEIDLIFLGWSAIAGLELGRRCTAWGRACSSGGLLVIWNPRYQIEAKETADETGGQVTGVK